MYFVFEICLKLRCTSPGSLELWHFSLRFRHGLGVGTFRAVV